MKILELTNYSAGICGVFSRVKEEALRLQKDGHSVKIFSSNLEKGTNKKVAVNDKIGNVVIKRFPSRKLGGESFMSWDFEKEAVKFKPDIVIAHSYRHLHTSKALRLKKLFNCKVFLVTHAPFVEKDLIRGLFSKITVNFYDLFIASRILNKFDKIIIITKWEIPHLIKLGAKKENIIYIPNGVSKEFFKQKKSKEQNKILFLGRISPIKNLEILIKAISVLEDKKIILEIVGPAEKDYLLKLKNLIKKFNLEKRILFNKPIFHINEKIKKIDSAKIFVLPSKRESMPQSLIEAMAREKIVIASKNAGTNELIKHGKNGLFFNSQDVLELAKNIEFALSSDIKKIKKEARKSVEQFSWDKIIKNLESLITDNF